MGLDKIIIKKIIKGFITEEYKKKIIYAQEVLNQTG